MSETYILFGIFSFVYLSLGNFLTHGGILTWNYIPLILFSMSSFVIYNDINLEINQKHLLVFSGHLSFIYLTSMIFFRTVYSVFNIVFYFGVFTTIIATTTMTIYFSSQLPSILFDIFNDAVKQTPYSTTIFYYINLFYDVYIQIKNIFVTGSVMIARFVPQLIIPTLSGITIINDKLQNNRYSTAALFVIREIMAEIKKYVYKYIVQPIIAKSMQSMLNQNLLSALSNNPNALANRGDNYRNSLLSNKIDMDLDKIDIKLDDIDDLDELDDLDDVADELTNNTSGTPSSTISPEKESRDELRKRLRQNINSKRNHRTGAVNRNIRNQLANASEDNPEFADTMKEMMQGDNLDKILNSVGGMKGADPAAMKAFLKKMIK